MSQRGIDAARRQRKDEFYTQLVDIEQELKHYRNHFQGQTVLCNCDDPYESNFFRFFAANFNFLGLKRLIAISYAGSPIVGGMLPLLEIAGLKPEGKQPYAVEINEIPDVDNDGAVDLSDVEFLLRSDANSARPLEGNGDFRSEECIEYLQKADIVVTNPPFSLFREFLAQLMEYEKKFLIIGNVNAITYRECFQLIRNDQMWLGPSIHSGDREFRVPDDYPLDAAGWRVDGVGNKYIRVKGVRWFTNLDNETRHLPLAMYRTYKPDLYPKYVNYDAIEVSRVVEIPMDYPGEMGVPITFLDKYNPDQFQIIGSNLTHAAPMSQFAPRGSYAQGGPSFYTVKPDGGYKRVYTRLLIKNRNPGSSQ